MKYLLLIGSLLLTFLFFSKSVAMPCPNGHGVLYKGDSISAVLSQCGEPTLKKTKTTLLNTTGQWVYYKRSPYNAGSSQMIITFLNNIVTRIVISERYWVPICRSGIVQTGALSTTTQISCGDWVYAPVYTNLCGTPFGMGAQATQVLTWCGEPSVRANIRSDVVETTDFYYTGNNPQIIQFTNGQLTDWK